MRCVAGRLPAAAGLRLFPGVGVELDDIAVGVANEDRVHALERELAAQGDAVRFEVAPGSVYGGDLERDVGSAGESEAGTGLQDG